MPVPVPGEGRKVQGSHGKGPAVLEGTLQAGPGVGAGNHRGQLAGAEMDRGQLVGAEMGRERLVGSREQNQEGHWVQLRYLQRGEQ